MFEKELEEKLRKIFGVQRISYADPGPMGEQETLFIEIEDSQNSISPPLARAKVTGTISMFGQSEKLPFGFFSKKIQEADPTLTRPFLFYELEQNTKRFQNLVQRSSSFVYFFRGQYDPDLGSITSIDLNSAET